MDGSDSPATSIRFEPVAWTMPSNRPSSGDVRRPTLHLVTTERFSAPQAEARAPAASPGEAAELAALREQLAEAKAQLTDTREQLARAMEEVAFHEEQLRCAEAFHEHVLQLERARHRAAWEHAARELAFVMSGLTRGSD